MSAHAVIAVRGGIDAKSRCRERLDASGRANLVEAMLADMLQALSACPSLDHIHVVTPTPALAALAARMGADVIPEESPSDLNRAFETARARIAAAAPDALVALLPGDLPLLDSQELEATLRLAGGNRIVLVPATADGGTGAVVQRADIELALAFGPDSFERHLASAEALALDVQIIQAPSLGFDVDRPEDLDVVSSNAPQGRTASLLRHVHLSTEKAG